jgi:uncharacterized membrane protein
MAGIGFVLRKLASKDDYVGILRAYFHSAIAAVGPWIFLVCSLGLISFFTRAFVGKVEVNEFFAILIYNLLFSFIFSSPFYMVAARYVADCLFSKEASPIPGILIQSLIYLLVVALPASTLFYVFYTRMTLMGKILSIVNFVVLCEIWFIMLYLSCIRNFRAITSSWVIGVIITALLGVYLGRKYGYRGMLFGTNSGLIFLLFSLQANILAEYPYRYIKPKLFAFYFSHYRNLFWSGFLLFAGMWVDKVIMWFSKEAVIHANRLRTYPIYDGAMFFSYLSIIPLMALFIFSLETNFYDAYIKYIRYIETNAPLSFIEEQKKRIIQQTKENGRSFLVLQGSLTLVVLVSAGTIFNFFGINYLEFGIFRLGTLGAFFAALNLIIIVFFSYFDSQENLLFLTAFLFFSNCILTTATLFLNFNYYGLGYALSMILTFFLASVRYFQFLKNLTYHVFISNVIKRVAIRQKGLQHELQPAKVPVEPDLDL